MTNPASNKWGVLFGALLLLLSGVSSVSAQVRMVMDEGLGITGLILDETRTKAGHDFFELFSVQWTTIPLLNYSITIGEQPDRGRGSFIKVSIDDTMVFFQRLNPRMQEIEELADRAIQVCRLVLVRRLETAGELEGAP